MCLRSSGLALFLAFLFSHPCLTGKMLVSEEFQVLTGNLPVRERKTLRKSTLLTGILPVSASFFFFLSKNLVKNRSLTGKLPVSNKTAQPFILIPDRCFACQWNIFSIIYMPLTGVLLVSQLFYVHWLVVYLSINELPPLTLPCLSVTVQSLTDR